MNCCQWRRLVSKFRPPLSGYLILLSKRRHPTASAAAAARLSAGAPVRSSSTTTTVVYIRPNLNSHVVPTRPFSTNPTERKRNPCSAIGQSVISVCSHIPKKKKPDPPIPKDAKLQELLKIYGYLSPETTRRFWRSPALKPEDFIEILLGFDPVVDSMKVDFLQRLFWWASRQCRDFHHLPRPYELMIDMLMEARRIRDAESLLVSAFDANVVLPRANLMISEIIQGYAELRELEKVVILYNQARDLGLVPSASCYRAVLDLLMGSVKLEEMLRVYTDMVRVGLVSGSENRFLDFVVGSLARGGRNLEAVNVIREAKNSGIVVSYRALTAIAEGYCRKMDFEDMISFLEEWKHVPEACVCNGMVSSLCRYLGADEARLFIQRMEMLGFKLDAITFGVLVSQSCREGQLRTAFTYLSEYSSRGIKPELYTYNALISGLFKEGMHWCGKEILEDMVENGLTPDLSTFKVLLAGYCKFRKFDEVKLVVDQMISCDMISLAPAEDALSKAFVILDLDKLGVRVKRDNDARLSRAEFFDSLGNGFYLEADLDNYELTLSEILDSAMLPEFDYVLHKEYQQNDAVAPLRVKDEVIQSEKSASLSTNAKLTKIQCALPIHIKKVIDLLDEMQNALLVAILSCGRLHEAECFLDQMEEEELIPINISYDFLITQLCLNGSIRKAIDLLNITLKKGNIPSETSYDSIIYSLCNCELFDQALDFHSEMQHKNLRPSLSTCHTLIYGLCANERTDEARRILRIMLLFGPFPTQNMYDHVANRYYTENNLDKASEVLKEMQHAGYSPNFETHWSLISNLSCCLGKDDDNRHDMGFLSSLLSGNGPPAKNQKAKGASTMKYAVVP